MKQQRGKMKKWAVLGISAGILGLGLWITQSAPILKAETEKVSTQKEVAKTKKTSVTTSQTLSAVSNDQGLSATPKVVQLAHNDSFPEAGTSKDELQKLVTTLVVPKSASEVKWQYVNEDGSPAVPSSETIGTQMVYLKITENANSSSIQVPVPITVTDDTVTIKDGVAYTSKSLDILQPSDVIGGTDQELSENLKNQLGLEAWDIATGEVLPISINDLDGLTEKATIGIYNLTYGITLPDKSLVEVKKEYTFFTEDVLSSDSNALPSKRFDEAGEIAGWTELELGSTEGVLKNPINKSTIGFNKRGQTGMFPVTTTEQGFLVLDGTGRTWIYGPDVTAAVPYVNGSILYPIKNSTVEVNKYSGAERNKMTSTRYFKRGNELKEVMIDTPNQVAYVYHLTVSRNLNFSYSLAMYNTAKTARNFGMLEIVDTGYIDDTVPMSSLGDNSGFQLKPGSRRLAIKLKDYAGNYLSEYTKFVVGANLTFLGKPYPTGLRNNNWFGSDFSKSGTEQYNYPAGYEIIKSSDKVDTAFQLGAPPRSIEPNEALYTGYEIYLGDEMKYMDLKPTKKEWNIYQDDPSTEFATEYELTGIPHAGGIGNIYLDYAGMPGVTDEFPFTATGTEAAGTIAVRRNKLPEKLNDKQGTVKSYKAIAIASHETPESEYMGMISNEETLSVNVYHLGGTPIAQVIKKDSTWTKTEASLIKDPVVLPGHTAELEYVNPEQPVDTSKVGLQFAEVRMTDKDEPTRTTIIKVPVEVVDTTPPTIGLIIGANDFSSSKAEIAGLTDEQLKAYILEKSEAVAWDIVTGLTEGVDLTVTDTTLTNPDTDGPHTATLQAKKGSTIVTKTIQINFSAKLIVNFVDEAGEPLNDPYTDTKEVGEMVDLTEITAITEILTKLKAVYDMEQPDTEIIKIANGENSMTYRFKGKLMYVSLPESFDFKLNIASYKKIRVDDPKVVGLPLVVSDTRLNTPGWSIKVKLQEELLNEDGKTILKNAVRYKFGDKEEILNSQSLKVIQNTKPGKYDVSQGWSAEGDGLKLEIPPGAVNALGKYHGEILFELSETP